MPHRDDLEAAHARIAALERELAAARKPDRVVRHPRRPPAPPADLEVDETPENLRIRWDWQPSLRGFFAALVFGGLALMALVGGREATGFQIVAIVTLGLLGMVFTYLFVQSVVNHTLIRVDSGQLSIESGPLALTGGRLVLKATDIDQLYVVMLSGRHSVWYSLHARMAGGKPRVLVGGIDEVERAFYLERALEHRLGIADRPVDGEVPRRPPEAAGPSPTAGG